MDLVQIMFGWRECFTTFALAEIGELAERRARFAPLDEFRVLGDVTEVLVVAKSAVSEEMVDLV